MSSSATANGTTAHTENDLTIEQLAAQTGMSVRNIRAHQARGLLAPPEVRMRVGYYGPEHVAQLRQIRELQDEGFNLNGIKRLLDDSDGTAERMQRFKQALTSAPYDEPAGSVTTAELGRKFRVGADAAAGVLGKAAQLGVLVPDGGEGYKVPSPSLLAVAEEVVARGIPVDSALDVFEQLKRHCDAVAHAFVRLFVRDVWGPFQQAGMPPEQWPQIDEAIDRLRPLASDALMAIFQQRMRTQIESAFGELTTRLTAEER